MSINNNNKTLLGSIVKSLDKRIILGDTDLSSISLLHLLTKYHNYATEQYNLGVTANYEKIKTLNRLIHELKYNCPDICIYKDRHLHNVTSAPPTIEANVITICFEDGVINIPYPSVIHNYNDPDNDLISAIYVSNITLSDNVSLSINNGEVSEDGVYPANSSFSINFEEENFTYITENLGDPAVEPCDSRLIKVQDNSFTHILNIDPTGNSITYQDIEVLTELPNDTIIYLYANDFDLATEEIDLIKDVVLDWYNIYRANHPDFNGSLVSNLFDNTVPGDTYTPGREGNILNTVGGSSRPYGDPERWLLQPADALLRYSYKVGEPAFLAEGSLHNYATGKNIVILNFNTRSTTYSPNLVVTSDNQPSPEFIEDYSYSIDNILNRLKFFKGLINPITQVGDEDQDNYLITDIAILNNSVLSPGQIDVLLGPDKKAEYTITRLQEIYDAFVVSPYTSFTELVNKGWSGYFEDYSFNLFDEVVFRERIFEYLDTPIDLVCLDNATIVSEVITEPIVNSFTVQVEDNNPLAPKVSNAATITINIESCCKPVPTCGIIGTTPTFTTNSYTFQVDDLFFEEGVNYLNFFEIELNPSIAAVYYKGARVFNDELPLIVSREDILNSELEIRIFVEDLTLANNNKFLFRTSYDGVNYCSGQNLSVFVQSFN